MAFDDQRTILRTDQEDVDSCREALEVAITRRDTHIWEAIDNAGMTQDDVAKATGLSRGAVKKALSRPRHYQG